MSSIILNPTLISNLNQLKNIPLPLLKYICDKICMENMDKSSALDQQLFSQILKDQKIQAVNWKKGLNSLKYLLKQSIKQQLPGKATAIFISESTLLSKDFAQHFAQKYEELTNKPQTPKLATVTDTNWGLYNLKQSQQGQIINKLYLKTQIQTFQNGITQNLVFTTLLPEHRYLASEVEEIYMKFH